MAIVAGHLPAEVPEDAAQGRVKSIYGELKDDLRTPLVPLPFRILASYPDFLELAWRQLKPNALTVYFENRADEIRRRAVESAAGLGEAPTPPDPSAREVIRIFLYIYPKAFLAVAALRSAANGQYPRLEELPAEEKRQIRPGQPDGAVAPSLVHPGTAPPDVGEIFTQVAESAGGDTVSDEYRALAQWPDFLKGTWTAQQSAAARPEYRRLARELHLMAESAILVLPFRVDFNPHTLRLSGLDEADIDAVRATLNHFYRLFPGLILNVARLSMSAGGREAALASPFPAALLAGEKA